MSRPAAVHFFTLFLSLCPQASSIFLKCHTYLSWSLPLQGHQAPQWIASPTFLEEALVFQAGLILPPLSPLVLLLSHSCFSLRCVVLKYGFCLFILPFPPSSSSWVITHKQDSKHIIRTRKRERQGPGEGPGTRTGPGKRSGTRTGPGEGSGTRTRAGEGSGTRTRTRARAGPGEGSGSREGKGQREGWRPGERGARTHLETRFVLHFHLLPRWNKVQ